MNPYLLITAYAGDMVQADVVSASEKPICPSGKSLSVVVSIYEFLSYYTVYGEHKG
jgi:hypothetical protein